MDARFDCRPAHGRFAWRLALLLGAVVTSGAGCPRMVEQYRLPVARTLPAEATLEQVTMVINENSSRIHSLSSSGARMSSSEFPTLRANLAVERPRRLRLVAEATALTGAEFDLGSNDEQFWFWVKRSQPPAMYYCRHDQFDSSAARNVMPVEPEWLIEALGVVTFDPADEHQGPFPVGRGRLEVRTLVRRATGNLTKVRVIDAAQGWIVAQHVYDSSGQRLATVLASGHKRDPLSQAVVPQRLEIQWPLTDFAMKLDLGNMTVNGLESDAGQLWARPEYDGWPSVNLATGLSDVASSASAAPVGPLAPVAAAPIDGAPLNSAPQQAASQGGTVAHQARFRAGSPLAAPQPSPPRQQQPLPERREILDYAAEPVLWR